MIVNVNFHGIGTPTERDFGPGEAEFWASPETFAATLEEAAANPDRIKLSFDDGNTTDVTVALPALRRRNLTATFFIVAGWLDERPGFITKHDVQALADAGMTIGNHGLEHHNWTELKPLALRHELDRGRERLQDITGQPVDVVAIPYGAYDDAVLAALEEYRHVYTSDGGDADPAAWLQPRQHVRADPDQPAG